MLYVSERARAELRKAVEAASNPGVRFRVYIDRLCNCGRPRFRLRPEERVGEGDTPFEVGGVPFVADAETVPKLGDVEIEYVNSWMQRGVIARNIDECGSCVDG